MANSTRWPTLSAAPTRAAWAASLGGELPLLLALIVIGLVAHGLNMFHFPAFTFTDDEGVYAAFAWAVLREGRLTAYTYYYAHAPAGWLQIAAWMGLTGGPHTFGGAIDSGRMLMLLLHLLMIPLLYRLARKLGCGVGAAGMAALLFSLSPLAIFYQRLLLLDNIMLFWILLSLDLLLDGWGRLSRVTLSGICFGVALLSKETAIFLLPAMLFIAWHQRWQHQGRFALVGWCVPMLVVLSWYPLFALLKGELFPSSGSANSIFRGTSVSGVSLIGALSWQATRGGGGMFNLDNQFWQFVRTDWLPRDPVLLVGGVAATALNLLRGIRDRRTLAAGLLGALPLYYLSRGGLVLTFYILFAIPFLCLNLAVLLSPVVARFPGRVVAALATVAGLALIGGYWQLGSLHVLYQERPDQAGREAIAWIKQHVPPDSKMIIRDDLWTALHEPGLGGPAFPNAHSHPKVAADPAVRDGVFRNDWRTVDYLVMTPDLDQDFTASNNTVALEALRHAHLVKRWLAERGDEALHRHQIVELWKVAKPGATETALLEDSAAYLASRFEQDGAYVAQDGTVTSEAQSYAMLRAVWSADRSSFDRAWRWTQAHLVDSDGLLHWLWRDGTVLDANTASDANTDVALALLLAGKRWNDSALLDAGERMVRSIWQREVVTVKGTPYLTAGNWSKEAPIVALNPSYFAPYAYRIFGEVDPEHDWQGVIESGYRVLFDASAAPLGATKSAGLPPDWVGLDRSSGKLVPLQLATKDTTRYGYDAARTYWRIALDLRWSGDGRAAAYLRQAGFLRDEVTRILADGITRKERVSGVYAHDGAVVEEASSMVGNAGALAALLTLDPAAANIIYAGQIVGGASRTGTDVYWGDPHDLYNQEWGWFATALYADALPDLWHTQ